MCRQTLNRHPQQRSHAMPEYLRAQAVEYLSLDLAHVTSPTVPDGEAMFVMTIRPEAGQSWQ
jgi:hypothetical protein